MKDGFSGARVDGVLWYHEHGFAWHPLCPKHHMRMQLALNMERRSWVRCEECQKNYELPREFNAQKEYINNKLEAQELKKLKFMNIDGEYFSLDEGRAESKDGKYFVTVVMTESKFGPQLVVYAGEKGKKDKSQIFVDPSTKRLSFDQNNLHPKEMFLKVEAIFDDGSKASIEAPEKK